MIVIYCLIECRCVIFHSTMHVLLLINSWSHGNGYCPLVNLNAAWLAGNSNTIIIVTCSFPTYQRLIFKYYSVSTLTSSTCNCFNHYLTQNSKLYIKTQLLVPWETGNIAILRKPKLLPSGTETLEVYTSKK